MTVLIITSVCLAPSMSQTPSKSFTCIFSWELSSLGHYYYYFLKFLCCVLVLSFEVLRCVIVSWFQKVLFALCALNALTTTVCLVAAALRYLQIDPGTVMWDSEKVQPSSSRDGELPSACRGTSFLKASCLRSKAGLPPLFWLYTKSTCEQ